MKEIIFVGTGGFIGSSLRYIVSTWFSQFSRFGFPLGTLAVNFIGCTLLGIFVGLGLGKTTTLPLREFSAIGILGGFTTFSAFGLESFELLKSGQLAMALMYIMGSMVMGLSGIGLGILIAR